MKTSINISNVTKVKLHKEQKPSNNHSVAARPMVEVFNVSSSSSVDQIFFDTDKEAEDFYNDILRKGNFLTYES